MDSSTKAADPPSFKIDNVVEWEHPPEKTRKSPRTSIKTRFSEFWEGVKRGMCLRICCPPVCAAGLDRKWCAIIAGACVLVLIAIGVGVGVGITRGKGATYVDILPSFCVLSLTIPSGSHNLPLPNNAERHIGDLTYYGVGLGACGITSTDNQDVVSVSHTLFDAVQTGGDPNANPLCGRKIRATRFYQAVGGERSVDLTVVDRCTGCQPTDLDVSTGAFQQLAPIPSGRVDVTWAWLSPQATGS